MNRRIADSISSFFDERTARFLAVAAGLFSAAVIAGLFWFALRYYPSEYFDDEKLDPLREQIKHNAGNAALREKYRIEDVRRRESYLRAQIKIRTGARLLFVGLAVFVLSMRRLSALTALPPVPAAGRERQREERERTLAALTVISVSLLAVASSLWAVAWSARERAPAEAAPAAGVIIVAGRAVETAVPDNAKWPCFRGPTHQGIVMEMPLPLSWNAARNENILWKTKVPLPGKSSPIIWGDRLFLTGADLRARKVFCFDRSTGRLLWECAIRSRAFLGEDFEPGEDTGLAAPTPATDGKRVFAFFGTNELAAVDFDGKQLWSTWFGKPDSVYGVSSSPIFHNGRVILQLDQGDRKAAKSFLYALDPADGRIIWKTPRPVPASWSSPVVIKTPQREEIITCADPFVISYDPETGKELWRAKVLSYDVATLAVYADGMVYVTNDNGQFAAIRTGGSGDVTDTHVAWTYDEDMPDVASPITDGKYVLQVAAGYGTITCLDAKTGKVVWRQDFDEMFWSSPSLVGERVYWTDMKGKTFIFKLADRYEQLGVGDVGEDVVASPAFADSRIYIRAKEHLYCIGTKQK